MSQDRPFLGILLMLGFCVLAPLGDALAKFLGTRFPVLELVAVRFVAQVLLLLPLVWLTKLPMRFDRRLLALTALRTVLHIAGLTLMFLALTYLPLADAVAIAFVMPFIMLLLGWSVLGEEIGARRLVACAVGFCGTLMVVQPSFAEVGWPALFPLGVAVVFALFMLVTRHIARDCDPIALQAVSGVMATAILVPALLVSTWLGLGGFALVMPQGADWGWFMAMGALGTLAHLVMTWSLRFAPTATLAPMQYLEIPIATLIGWWVFRDFPNGLALAGIVVTMAAGLYVIARERATSRAATPAAPPAAPPAA
jgi:drug/metabolite transporter (DMT)-like permease